MPRSAHPFATLLFNLLVVTVSWRRFRWFKRLTKGIERVAEHSSLSPVAIRIHGQRFLVNFGYTYPLASRLYPNLNCPLVEAAHLVRTAKGRPILAVDVGAAVGDTVALIERNCPGAVGRWICVEGDDEFFGYLEHNLKNLTNVSFHKVLLSDHPGVAPELVRTHPGTASAQGPALRGAITLDMLLGDLPHRALDLLKVDVDGFDGRVLAGGARRLASDQPVVVFEWHPSLCRETGNSPTLHFEVLEDCGYSRFAWFTKTGEFSHFTCRGERRGLLQTIEACTASPNLKDWHFDIVAVPDTSLVEPNDIAWCAFARRRSSRF